MKLKELFEIKKRILTELRRGAQEEFLVKELKLINKDIHEAKKLRLK